jgi:hypothetical protein
VIALTELLEAEVRAFRRGAMRMGAGLALTGLSALLGALGIGLLLWALFQGLITLWGEVVAALLAGLAALVTAGVLAWLASRMSR